MTSTVDRLAATALIPFWARVQDAHDDESILNDQAASALAPAVADRFGILTVDETTQLGCCLRNHAVDRWLTHLVADGVTTIVDIGAGLDTRSARMSAHIARHIEVDHSSIIDLRHELLPAGSTARIAADGLDIESWLPQVDTSSGGTAVVLEGVLAYQEPQRVRAFFGALADRLPGAFVLFDSVSPLSALLANRAARRTGAHPAYCWSTWRTSRLVDPPGRWHVVDERGLLELRTERPSRLNRRAHLLYSLPILRRSYRLTVARLCAPGEGHGH
jgi:O-methyltransferase involved in polyketide biosynthesis